VADKGTIRQSRHRKLFDNDIQPSYVFKTTIGEIVLCGDTRVMIGRPREAKVIDHCCWRVILLNGQGSHFQFEECSFWICMV